MMNYEKGYAKMFFIEQCNSCVNYEKEHAIKIYAQRSDLEMKNYEKGMAIIKKNYRAV